MLIISLPVLIIIILIVCLVSKTPDRSWVLDLQRMKGHQCEIVMKEFGGAFPYSLRGQGVLLDVDDEWILIQCEYPNGVTKKMLRIAEIETVQAIH